LGEGGMGTVYQVKHRALGKRFALKALRRDLAADGEIAARFIQEARTAAAVSHPGLVEITDFGRLGSGQVYFVMELLEGPSLAALLRVGGPLPAARGLEIARQLVNALKAAHDSAIVHRDLKPDNIHVGRGDAERDLVKIVDFGLAKVIGASKLTRAGMVFGTPHYMSPEQAAGEVVDHRADIYALGIVMYEMFTGKVPFEADSYMGVLTKHMYMTPAPPSEHRLELKEIGALEDIILRCLQKRPANRYDNLAGLLLDLDQMGLTPGTATGVTTRKRSRPASVLADQLELPTRGELERPRPARIARPLAVVLLAFLLGVALVIVLRKGGSRSSLAPDQVRDESRSVPASAPQAFATVSPALTSSGSRSSPQGATLPPSVPSTRAKAGAQAEGLPARKPSYPTAPPPRVPETSKPPPRLGGGEIVDPWAR